MTLVACQSPTEILADKIVSFSNSVSYVRYRDLWDIPWLMQRPGIDTEAVAEFVRMKHRDYSCAKPLGRMLEDGAGRAMTELASGTFAMEMERFIPSEIISRTIARGAYLDLMGQDIADAFRLAIGNVDE